MARILPCFLLAAPVLAGCSQAEQTVHGDSESSQAVAGQTSSENKKANGTNFWERLEMLPLYDPRGVVAARIPVPASWEMNKARTAGTPTFTGPNGLAIADFAPESFTYVTDPYLQQSYYQAGVPMRSMPGVEQIIEQDLIPKWKQRGYTFVSYAEVPEVSKIDRWYTDQLYKAVPTQSENAAIGTEWKDENGHPYFLLMHLSVSTTAQMQNWYYFCTDLKVEPAHYEKAKKQLLFALANTRYALEPIAEYNRQEAEKAGRSWAAHNQRMAQNQAQFEAQQRAFINKSNAINDAIMSGWRAQNQASDKAHEQFIDVITERTNVVNTETGKTYKVEAGYNNYWMNADGEYISTDQYNYNPNLDEHMNNQNWQQLNEIKTP